MVSCRSFFKFTSLILALSLAACGSAPLTGLTSTPTIMLGPKATLPVNPTLPVTPTTAATQKGNGDCTNPFFPVSSGATWSYASTGSISGDYNYTRSVSGLGGTGFTTNDAFNTGLVRTLNWTCDKGNLTYLPPTGNPSLSSSSMVMVVESVNSTGYSIPFSISDGDTWSEDLMINGIYVQGSEKKGTGVSEVTTNCSALGTESVKVPAGTFEAVKITCHSVHVTTVTLKGKTNPPVTTTQDSIQWFVQGVGVVQMANSGDGGDETIQLTQYSLP